MDKHSLSELEEINGLIGSFVGYDTRTSMAFITILVNIVLTWFSVPLETLLRYRQGQRSYTFAKVIMAAVVLAVYIFITVTSGSPAVVLGILWVVFVIVALYHLLYGAWRWYVVRSPDYAKGPGRSWLWLIPLFNRLKNPWHVFLWIEPLFCYVIGGLLWYIEPGLMN